MSTPTLNGRVQRKTLANQLDRLDTILDGFADALNEAVAEAVKQAVTVAVREAVQVAVQQLLTNPELLRALAAQAAPAPTPKPEPQPEPAKKPSLLRQLATWTGTKGHRFGKAIEATSLRFGRRLKAGASSVCSNVKNRLHRVWQLTRPVVQWCRDSKRTLGLALCVGTVVGLGSFVAGPVIASVACGLCSAVLTVAARVL